MEKKMAELWKGKAVADALDVKTSETVKELAGKGVKPTLAIIRVGEREDDLSYERGAAKRCEKNGVGLVVKALPESVTTEELLETVEECNNDPSIHGILLFRPLPKTIDEKKVCESICPKKDVDGVTSSSAASLYMGYGDGYAPCTAEAVVELLEYYGALTPGIRATVVGRSLVIGKPVAMMLLAKQATVTICHSRTKDLANETSKADLLVAALGKQEFIGSEHVGEGQKIVDVGIHWSEEKNKLVGDVDTDAVADKASALTPVPGGVGSVTTAVLVRHTVEACMDLLN